MSSESRSDRRLRTSLSDEELQCRRVAVKLLTGRMQIKPLIPGNRSDLLPRDFVGDAVIAFGPRYTALGDQDVDHFDEYGDRIRAPKSNFGGLDAAGLNAALHLFEEYFGLPDLRDHDVSERAEAVALKLMELAR